jgi:hypothetical protein
MTKYDNGLKLYLETEFKNIREDIGRLRTDLKDERDRAETRICGVEGEVNQLKSWKDKINGVLIVAGLAWGTITLYFKNRLGGI